MKTKKPMAPKPQTMPMTKPTKAEKKTQRPSAKAKLDTPRVPFAPKSAQRMAPPKMTGKARV